MYLKALLIFSFLLLIVDAGMTRRLIPPDAVYLRAAYRSEVQRERARIEEESRALRVVSEVNARSAGIASRHAELREEYKKAAGSPGAASGDDEAGARINGLRGLLGLESEAFRRSLERLGDFHYGRVPRMPRRVLEYLPFMSESERSIYSGEHLKKGIGYFQSEDLEGAIRMWEAAVELDPGNGTAAEYRERAETILRRLNEIRNQTGPASPDRPPTRPPS